MNFLHQQNVHINSSRAVTQNSQWVKMTGAKKTADECISLT